MDMGGGEMFALQNFLELTRVSESFTHKVEEVDGVEFDIFFYRFATFSDFKSNEHLGSLEARGIAFLGERAFPAFHKFFNWRENPYTDFSIGDDEIVVAQEKIDGSLIHPIVVEDRLFVKSKTSFLSEHAEAGKELLENDDKKRSLVFDLYKDGFVPLFELIGPGNQVVVRYDEDDLVLLAVRSVYNGRYLPLEEVEKIAREYGVSFAKWTEMPFHRLRTILENEKGIEGFVAFLNDNFVKFKTRWYLNLHSFISEIREDVIFHAFLDDKLDDILINIDGEKKKIVEEIAEKVKNVVNEKVRRALELFSEYRNIGFDRKSFALKYRNEELFPAVIGKNKEEEVVSGVADLLKRRHRTLSEVRRFLSLE
jgi:T4 RnlA family RNA ligase